MKTLKGLRKIEVLFMNIMDKMVKDDKQMHDIAKTYLAKREFNAAIEAYKSILNKYPHDFVTLRGLMLAAAHLSDTDELIGNEKKGFFSYDPDIVDEVKKAAPEKDMDYFLKLGKIYSDKKRMFDLSNEIQTLEKDHESIEESIKEKREMSYNFNIRGFSPKGRYFISLSIVIACVVSGIFTGVYAKINDLELQPLIFLIVICGIVGVILNLITFSKYRYVIMLNKMIKAHCVEQDEIKEKLKRLYVEADKLKAGIKNSSADFVNKDEAIMYEIRTQNLSCNP
ncbi:MAG: hypothetical protein J5515_05945 [Lachnospiraceae bacterium]|nr:hypothetical protein [Lachnospiraceae bacterium]